MQQKASLVFACDEPTGGDIVAPMDHAGSATAEHTTRYRVQGVPLTMYQQHHAHRTNNEVQALTPVMYRYAGQVRKAVGLSDGMSPDGEGSLQLFRLAGSAAADCRAVEAAANSRCPPAQTEDSCNVIATYTGGFVDGRRHGRGTLALQSPSKFKLSCDWDHDVPLIDTGLCTLTNEDGDEYCGMVSMISDGRLSSREELCGLEWATQVRFLPDATGEIVYSEDRRRYCGEWQCGQRHGFGVETDCTGSYVFIGGFDDDVRDGPGTLFQVHHQSVVSGAWKDGELLPNSVTVHFPNRIGVLQSHTWENLERFEFHAANLMLRSHVVDGIWEPLFVTFDTALASSVADLVTSGSLPSLLFQEPASASDVDPSQPLPSPRRKDMKLEALIKVMEQLMDRDDFRSIVSTFQRCMYFVYGSCIRYCDDYLKGVASNKRREVPSSQRSNCATGVASLRFPESWCCCLGLPPQECLHGNLREKKTNQDTLHRLIGDIASFVFSVRLRLQSFVAAIPSACDMNIGSSIVSLCWDCAMRAVEPLVMSIAGQLSQEATVSSVLAAQRCGTTLSIDDFVAASSLFSLRGCRSNNNANGDEEQGSVGNVKLFAAAVDEVDDLYQQLLFPRLASAGGRPTSRSSASPVQPLRRSATTRNSASGLYASFDVSVLPLPSKCIDVVARIHNATRRAACLLDTEVGAALSSGPSPSSSYQLFHFIQEQLHLYFMHKYGHLTHVDAICHVMILLLSESTEPQLPGAADRQRGPATPAGPEDADAEDSIMSHSFAADMSDVEKQAVLRSRYQILMLRDAAHRASTLHPLLRLPVLQTLQSLKDLVLRVEHLLLVRLFKPSPPQYDSDGDSDESDSDAGEDIATAASSFAQDPSATAEQTIRKVRGCLPRLACLHHLREELRSSVKLPLTAPDISPEANDTLLWILQSVPVLLATLRSQLAQKGIQAAFLDSTALSNDARPPPLVDISPTSACIRKSLRRPLEAMVWYRDLIPRMLEVSSFTETFFGITVTMKFFASAMASKPVAPELASIVILEAEMGARGSGGVPSSMGSGSGAGATSRSGSPSRVDSPSLASVAKASRAQGELQAQREPIFAPLGLYSPPKFGTLACPCVSEVLRHWEALVDAVFAEWKRTHAPAGVTSSLRKMI